MDRTLESEAPDPWWYRGYWKLKGVLPAEMRSRVKTMLQRGVDALPLAVRERDDATWEAIQKSEVPDPFEPPRSRRDLLNLA